MQKECKYNMSNQNINTQYKNLSNPIRKVRKKDEIRFNSYFNVVALEYPR